MCVSIAFCHASNLTNKNAFYICHRFALSSYLYFSVARASRALSCLPIVTTISAYCGIYQYIFHIQMMIIKYRLIELSDSRRECRNEWHGVEGNVESNVMLILFHFGFVFDLRSRNFDGSRIIIKRRSIFVLSTTMISTLCHMRPKWFVVDYYYY